VQLHLKAPQRPFVADGPVSLELSLTNESGAAVDAPVPGQNYPFEFTILDAAGEKTIAIASHARAEAAVPHLGSRIQHELLEQSLGAGEVLSYTEDVTALLPAPLSPARYLLEGTFQQAAGAISRSERVPIEVQPSLPVASAQTLDPRPESVIIVEFHDQQDGSLLLRKRQSDHRLLGRFYDMRTVQPSSPVRRIAIGVEADFDAPRHWRWVAWIDGGSIRSGVVRATDFVAPADAIPVDLEQPVLLDYGYVFEDGSGMFAVTGFRSGQRKIRLITIPPARGKPEVVEMQLTGGLSPIPNATLVWTEAGSPELILTWSLEGSSGNRVVQARVDPKTGSELSGIQSLLSTDRRVVEVSCPPVVRPGTEGRIQVLVAPAAAEDPYTYGSFDVADPSSRSARHLPPLAKLPGESVERWVLPSSKFPEAPVLAVSKGEFWITEKEDWRRVAEADPAADSVRLWAFDATTYYCTWFDTVRGYQAVSLRLAG